jgi:hypothetical protein
LLGLTDVPLSLFTEPVFIALSCTHTGAKILFQTQRAGQYRGSAAASQALKETLRVTYEEIPEQGAKRE